MKNKSFPEVEKAIDGIRLKLIEEVLLDKEKKDDTLERIKNLEEGFLALSDPKERTVVVHSEGRHILPAEAHRIPLAEAMAMIIDLLKIRRVPSSFIATIPELEKDK